MFQGFAGLAVSMLIIYIGIKYGKQSLLILLDANLDPKTVKILESIAINMDGIEGVHDIKIRRSGPYVLAELHIETEKDYTIEKGDEISQQLEKLIRNELKELDSLLIKVDPLNKTMFKIAVPVDKEKGLKTSISKHFGKAPYYLIAEIENDNIKSYLLKKNPAVVQEQKKGLKTAQFLVEENVDIVLFGGKVHEGPSYALSSEMISVVKPEGKTLRNALINAARNK